MVAVDLSTFMLQLIERIGRQPDSIENNSYMWRYPNGEIRLIVGCETADITVELFVESFSDDPGDSYYHHYELAEYSDWNGASMGTDRSCWVYDELVETVGCQVAANLNLS